MSLTVGSASGLNAIRGTEFEGMSVQMMAAMVMLEVGATKKKEAELKIAEMKSQNDRAKSLNDFCDRLNAQLGQYTKDDDESKGTAVANVNSTATTKSSSALRARDSSSSNALVTSTSVALRAKGNSSSPLVTNTSGSSSSGTTGNNTGRAGVLDRFREEAKTLGIDTSDWSGGKTSEQARAITSRIQHMAENCNSDNQTQMVKLQDFMGQYNSFVSGASDMIKTANQILQGLAKN